MVRSTAKLTRDQPAFRLGGLFKAAKRTRRKRTLTGPARKKLRKVFLLAGRFRKKGLSPREALQRAYGKAARKGYKRISGKRKKAKQPKLVGAGGNIGLGKKRRVAKRTKTRARKAALEARFGAGSQPFVPTTSKLPPGNTWAN